jgi:hypothetical protein
LGDVVLGYGGENSANPVQRSLLRCRVRMNGDDDKPSLSHLTRCLLNLSWPRETNGNDDDRRFQTDRLPSPSPPSPLLSRPFVDARAYLLPKTKPRTRRRTSRGSVCAVCVCVLWMVVGGCVVVRILLVVDVPC